VLLDRLDADLQRAADFLVAQPQGHVAEDLGLALGEWDLVVIDDLADLHGARHAAELAGAGGRLAGLRCRDGLDERLAIGALEHEIAGPQGDGAGDVGRVVVGREHDHLGVGDLGPQLLQGGQAVAVRHADVQQHDVRLGLLREFDGFLSGRGLAHDLDVRPLEQGGQAGADDLVIIRDKQSHAHGGLPKRESRGFRVGQGPRPNRLSNGSTQTARFVFPKRTDDLPFSRGITRPNRTHTWGIQRTTQHFAEFHPTGQPPPMGNISAGQASLSVGGAVQGAPSFGRALTRLIP